MRVRPVVLSCLFLLLFTFDRQGEPKQQSTGENAGTLKVTITADRTKIKPGEALTLRVQIENKSKTSMYVATEFDGPDNALSKLNIFLFHNGSLLDSGPERFGWGLWPLRNRHKAPLGNGVF